MFPTINKKETGVNLRRIMDMREVKRKRLLLINIEIIEIQFLVLFHISQLLTHKCTSTSIIAKLTPYISTIIMSRIVIKIGNCNLFLYSAIFTLQPKVRFLGKL
jgi:hypothetical protein